MKIYNSLNDPEIREQMEKRVRIFCISLAWTICAIVIIATILFWKYVLR